MPDRKVYISEEEILFLSDKVNKEKFLKRQKEFSFWTNSFITAAKGKNIFPVNARLLQDMNVEEMALYLNYFYWQMIEEFVKKVLRDGTNGDIRINHYKIAATIEFIVMKYLPFEDDKGIPLKDLNADFAFHIALQILFSWNLEKDKIDSLAIKELLTDNKPTLDFIEEHKTWLRHYSIANQFIILSNMQTLRLFHYWFRDPKGNEFGAH